MVQTFTCNDVNDIFIDPTGNLSISNGLAAVQGACLTISKSQLGEMVLQTLLGIPNFQAVWIGAPNYGTFSAYLRNALLNVAGVTNIKSLTVKPVSNTLGYTVTIATAYGEAEING